MEIKQLRSFVTVAECKSFSRAAQILYLSQPSISTHISMLEQEIGVKLMERNSKSLYLTDEGREFYEYALNILKLNDKMLDEIGSKSAPSIHIGASTVPSAYILPDILADYTKNHEGCRFNIVQSDSRKVIDGILEGLFDVGFVGRQCHEKGIESRVIAQDEMVLIMPDNDYYSGLFEEADSHEKHKDAVRRILTEPIILREEGSGSGEIFKQVLAAYDLDEKNTNPVAVSNDPEAIINMVEKGIGVSCISYAVLSGKHKRNVICLHLPEIACRRNFYIIYKQGALNRVLIGEFITSILEKVNWAGIYKQYPDGEVITHYIDDLGLTGKSVVSVVGAGGKSTLIEALADEYVLLGSDVIITTTTHIRKPRGKIARNASELKDILMNKSKAGTRKAEKIYLGIPIKDKGIYKLKAVSDDTFKELFAMASKNNIPVLIEADGAKGLPCKVPAEYEPVIRAESDVVIGVLSERAVGGKIKDVCHRPQMVSRLLEKGINDIITEKDLDMIFTDSKGLRKGVTQGMRYIPLMRIG